jgi:murein DD-endopeptidase MepM/ murein hydrolase activator NlpD
LTTLQLQEDSLHDNAYDLAAIFPFPLFGTSDLIKDENENNGQTTQERSTTTVYLAKTIQDGEFVGAKVATGKIKSNFYVDARNAGVPADIVNTVVMNLSSKVDFRRSLQSGDSFEIMYDPKNKLIYSKITTRRREFSVYRYSFGKESAYFFASGERVVPAPKANSGAFFGPPLLGKLSVSDGFGVRLHPITRHRHIHSGVDFVVPVGTPVIAVYDGVVTRASYYGGYGYCVDVSHPNGYSSRYAHLSKFKVRPGQKVNKGQILALSGRSGLVTGAHCHMELAKNRKPINPFSVKMMPVEKPKVARVVDARAFRSYVNRVNKTVDSAV